ncbi:pyocin knob domain-containing protein [Roseovarius pacificus]|uniref:pyocin knob domain-containing protein n=1 Tax=Roseovarius pacificus TaxID=337701 RepID=UPI002A18836A|nr:pyocin knob domain-containing protein [Roseovarius pacificus]
MELRTFFAQNLDGDALALATVTVWNAGTSDLAAIFKSDGDPQANPFQASSAGAIAFAARNGVYDIFVQENGGTATQQINGVRFFDPADQQLSLGDIDGWPASVTSAKLSYLGGVTGAIQPQLDGKVAAPEGSIVEFGGNIDDPAQLPVGFYQVRGDATGDKPVASFNLISLRRGSAPHGNGAQIAILVGTNTHLARSYNGSSWTPWAEFYTAVTLPQSLVDIRDMEPSDGDIVKFDGSNFVPSPAAITEKYKSTQQSITTGGSVTVNHGLSGEPEFMFLDAICVTANNGYSVGDRIPMGTTWPRGSGVSNRRTIHAIPTLTQILLQAGTADFLQGVTKDGTGDATLSLSDWEFVVRAYR